MGGSLGGLATGLALKAIGHDTTILERNPTPVLEQQGAGIVAGGDTLAFFKRYNRCDRPIAVTSHRRQYLDKEGKVVHKEDMDQNMTSVSCVQTIRQILKLSMDTTVGSGILYHACKLRRG